MLHTVSEVINVQLVNFSRSDQWLNEGMVLGQISSVDFVEECLENETNGPKVGMASVVESPLRFAESINKDLPPAD